MSDIKEYRINDRCMLVLEEEKPFLVTPYSLFLAEHFLQHVQITAESRLLDFGTGCGIQAITAALCGAGQVYGVDIHQQALELTRRNMHRNAVAHQVCTINNHSKGWESALGRKVDYIISNPASLPAPNTLEATFWAGLKGQAMIEELVQVAGRVLVPYGVLFFVHTSLVCLRDTLTLLQQMHFTVGIVAIKKLQFRDFYTPLLPYWQELRARGEAFWLEEEGRCYELLYCIKAEKQHAL
jgi:tRNA1(Val) A37 N6-methylase TrmN6